MGGHVVVGNQGLGGGEEQREAHAVACPQRDALRGREQQAKGKQMTNTWSFEPSSGAPTLSFYCQWLGPMHSRSMACACSSYIYSAVCQHLADASAETEEGRHGAPEGSARRQQRDAVEVVACGVAAVQLRFLPAGQE